MKKLFLCILFVFIGISCFSEEAFFSVLKDFDSEIMKNSDSYAETTIGFITYSDTNTCGSVVEWFNKEIKLAAESTRRIKIADSNKADEVTQAVVATRSIKMGVAKVSTAKKKYVIDGIYEEEGDFVNLTLRFLTSDGSLISEREMAIPKAEITKRKLTLRPENVELATAIQQDFDTVIQADVTESSHNKEAQNTNDEKSSSIKIYASMLDNRENLVNILHPGDIVNFKISTDKNCYLAILMIDAEGEKQWLPMENDYMRAGAPRYFPDIDGAVLQVADGIFGAEQIIIYAASKRQDLPAQTDEGIYKKQDLQLITRKLELKQSNTEVASGMFKITYTVVR